MNKVLKLGALAFLVVAATAANAQVTIHSSQPAVIVDPFTGSASSIVKGPSSSSRAFWQLQDESWMGPWGLQNGAANTQFSAASLDVNWVTGRGVGSFQAVGNRSALIWQNANKSWNFTMLDNMAGSCQGKPATVTNSNGEWTTYIPGPEGTVDIWWESAGNRLGPLGVANGVRGVAYGDLSAAINPTNDLKCLTSKGPDGSVNAFYEVVENGKIRLIGPIMVAPAGSAKSSPVIAVNHVGNYMIIAWQNNANSFEFCRSYSSGIYTYWASPKVLSKSVGKLHSGLSVVSDPVTGLTTWAGVGDNNRTDTYWISSNGAYNGPFGLHNGAANTSFAIPGMAIDQVSPTQTEIKMLVVGAQHQLREYWRKPDFTWHGPKGLAGDAPNQAY